MKLKRGVHKFILWFTIGWFDSNGNTQARLQVGIQYFSYFGYILFWEPSTLMVPPRDFPTTSLAERPGCGGGPAANDPSFATKEGGRG